MTYMTSYLLESYNVIWIFNKSKDQGVVHWCIGIFPSYKRCSDVENVEPNKMCKGYRVTFVSYMIYFIDLCPGCPLNIFEGVLRGTDLHFEQCFWCPLRQLWRIHIQKWTVPKNVMVTCQGLGYLLSNSALHNTTSLICQYLHGLISASKFKAPETKDWDRLQLLKKYIVPMCKSLVFLNYTGNRFQTHTPIYDICIHSIISKMQTLLFTFLQKLTFSYYTHI